MPSTDYIAWSDKEGGKCYLYIHNVRDVMNGNWHLKYTFTKI